MKPSSRLGQLIIFAFTASLIAGCAQTPNPSLPKPRPAQDVTEPTTRIQEPTEPEIEAMREALRQSETALEQNHILASLSLLQQIQPTLLSARDQATAEWIAAKIHAYRGHYREAKALYQSILKRNEADLPRPRQTLLEEQYALAQQHHDQQGLIAAGLELVLRYEPQVPSNIIFNLSLALAEASPEEARDILESIPTWTRGPIKAALASDALVKRDLGSRLCEAWQNISELETAVQPLCTKSSKNSQAHLIVALPLSGRLKPAGEAILDGIVAAHLITGHETQLEVLDTDTIEIAALANQLQAKPRSRLIGPLEKEKLAELASLVQPERSVIGLNTLENSASSSNILQLALSPESEARDLAKHVFATGARRILIIRPQTDWGARTLLAVRSAWESLGGTEVATATYRGQDDYEAALQVALGVADSSARRRELGRISGLSTHLQTRRRQDIDAIVMLASSPQEARSLKPLLAFHFADDLPTFALSVINELPSQIDHKDLDSLYALEIPTIPPFPESRANSASLARLNALGMDAYHLAESTHVDTGKLRSLQRGYTGLLYLDDEKKLIRHMNLYRYDQETLRRE